MDTRSKSIENFNIGVLGAGQMGTGIATACLLNNYPVSLYDPQENALSNAKEKIEHIIKKKVDDSENQKKTFSNFKTTQNLSELISINFVIEAVPEILSIKQKLYKELSDFLKPNTYITSNTSSLSIQTLSQYYSNPSLFCGLHFMNPAHVMPLVEIISLPSTDLKMIEDLNNFVYNLHKIPVQSADQPGFIVNRILLPMINEAIYALAENVATAEDIDKAMKLGANHPIGPLALADMIGLDVCYSILKNLEENLNNSKYAPCPLLKTYIDQGKLGKKTKQGFYSY